MIKAHSDGHAAVCFWGFAHHSCNFY